VVEQVISLMEHRIEELTRRLGGADKGHHRMLIKTERAEARYLLKQVRHLVSTKASCPGSCRP